MFLSGPQIRNGLGLGAKEQAHHRCLAAGGVHAVSPPLVGSGCFVQGAGCRIQASEILDEGSGSQVQRGFFRSKVHMLILEWRVDQTARN